MDKVSHCRKKSESVTRLLQANCSGSKIYIFDGFQSDDTSGYCFDTVDNAWHSIPGPTEKDQYFSATAFIDGTIYITGGHINGARLSCMRKFDVVKREWSQGKSMNVRRCAPAYCVYEGRFYVFGGNQSFDDIHASCEYYSPHTDSWKATSPMAMSRCGAAAAVLGGKIYVVGGLDKSQTRSDMERYDPSTDTWETLKSLRTGRACATMISSCGKLFVVGGFDYDKNVPISTMEIYDPEANCWEEVEALPEYAVNFCALSIPATFAMPFVNLETTFSSSHSSGFGCLVANDELLKAIHDKAFNHPSKIQHQFIPRVAHGLDVVCQSKSGTGKSTLSAIATLQQLEPMGGQVSALVLCKSRELATKMGETFKDLCKYLPSIKVAVFSGDCRIKKNRGILMNNCPHVVVGTPGRVLALAQSGVLKLNNIKQFVIDNCDEMVNDQEMHRDLRKLVKYLPQRKQVMILSTENSSELGTFCKSLIRDEVPNNTTNMAS
ncbi:hypothetical protein PRIPAC_83457 [Pristionchus pacificus]|nr:hypothetical protein PRIPAC_83457 [Pristionchus pacificus]